MWVHWSVDIELKNINSQEWCTCKLGIFMNDLLHCTVCITVKICWFTHSNLFSRWMCSFTKNCYHFIYETFNIPFLSCDPTRRNVTGRVWGAQRRNTDVWVFEIRLQCMFLSSHWCVCVLLSCPGAIESFLNIKYPLSITTGNWICVRVTF
jgi:hypothetical protein